MPVLDIAILTLITLVVLVGSIVGVLLLHRKNRLPLATRILVPTAAVLLSLSVSALVYLNLYSHATEEANDGLLSDAATQVTETNDYYYFDNLENQDNAIIFYGGGKIEEKAYAPLAKRLSSAGIDVFLLKMPFHFPLFGIDKADSVRSSNLNYSHVYLMGHSLGGTCASMCLSKSVQNYEGIIFLASFPNAQLQENRKALSIYGSNDKVLNLDSYEKAKPYFPKDTSTYVIEGGNHAGFAYYGNQSGDGVASISRQTQIDLAVGYVSSLFQH